jgi:hypothetical protein
LQTQLFFRMDVFVFKLLFVHQGISEKNCNGDRLLF